MLDTQSVVDIELKILLILGRPFLATANALINCRNGHMKLSFGNMTLEVNIFNVSKQPHDSDECCQMNLIDTAVEEVFHSIYGSETLKLLHDGDDLEPLCYPVESEYNVSTVLSTSQDTIRRY